MRKVTAVEWLEEQLKINNYISDNAHWLIDEAKEMHKQQVIEALTYCLISEKHAKQYYNETFKKL